MASNEQKFDEKFFDRIIIRPLRTDERERWKQEFIKHHYLGDTRLLGERIEYVATVDDEWIACLSWAECALKLSSRDQWIGWNERLKKKRLKFIVNNWRFLILPRFRQPNLGSRLLALNLSRLNNDWLEKYGHPILMVETFVEEERFIGGVYRADNWLEIGKTKGFSKFKESYTLNDRPKRIFIKDLIPGAKDILASPITHPMFMEESERVKGNPVINVNAIKIFGPNGLMVFAQKIQDSRSANGLRHRKEGLFIGCILAVLSGATGFNDIARWIKTLPEEFREKIKLWNLPSQSTIRRFLIGLNTQEIDQQITSWLLKQDSLRYQVISVDGKTLRGTFKRTNIDEREHLLSAVVHETGVVVAQSRIPEKKWEITEARDLLQKLPIENTIISADALHCQDATADLIVKKKDIMYLQ